MKLNRTHTLKSMKINFNENINIYRINTINAVAFIELD